MKKTISEIRERPLFPEGSALVIGGSGGIGESVCKNFISHGVPVIFTYFKNNKSASKLAKEIKDIGGEAEGLQLSLTDKTQDNKFFE